MGAGLEKKQYFVRHVLYVRALDDFRDECTLSIIQVILGMQTLKCTTQMPLSWFSRVLSFPVGSDFHMENLLRL